jgi:hypothetical protein
MPGRIKADDTCWLKHCRSDSARPRTCALQISRAQRPEEKLAGAKVGVEELAMDAANAAPDVSQPVNTLCDEGSVKRLLQISLELLETVIIPLARSTLHVHPIVPASCPTDVDESPRTAVVFLA